MGGLITKFTGLSKVCLSSIHTITAVFTSMQKKTITTAELALSQGIIYVCNFNYYQKSEPRNLLFPKYEIEWSHQNCEKTSFQQKTVPVENRIVYIQF